ncbi:MAG: ABC transporter permease [Christensenellaceae bacterium]|nr:ABC transporter permease [Christensenellaceae bacterium]
MPLFIVAPMIFVLYYALFRDGQFTLDFVKQVFSDTTYVPALWNSVWIALVTTVVCLLAGYPVAYILSHMKTRTAALVSMLFILPMWMNMLLRTLAWKILLYDDGIIINVLSWFGINSGQLLYTPGAVLIATIYDFLPFMILPIYTTLMKIDSSHIEAAHDLGANGAQTFMKVVLPQSVPGIISGITMVFVPAMSTFAVSTMLGGKKVLLLGQVIEEKFLANKSFGVGSTLSLVLIVLVILSMVIMRSVDRENGREGGTLW